MATLAEIRQQYPGYADMSDGQLADALYNKFYSDMPRDQFNAKVGFDPGKTDARASWERLPKDRTFLKGVEQGVGDVVVGATQLGAHALPSAIVSPEATAAVDRAVADRERTIQASRPDQYQIQQQTDDQGRASHVAVPAGKGFDLPRTLGNVAATAPLAVTPPVVSATISAATMPIAKEGNFWRDKLVQTGTAAAVGGLTQAAGALVSPQMRPQARALLDEGVSLTPGQMAGQTAKRIEDKASSIPIVGETISAAQRKSIEEFNRATIDRTLAPIGGRLPKGASAGYEAVAEAADQIGAAYNKVLPRVRLKADPQLATDIQSLGGLTSYMPPDQSRQFLGVLQDRVVNRLAGGTLDGETVQQIRSELRNFGRQYMSSPDAAQRQLGDAIRTLDMHLGDAVVRQNPTLAPQLRSIDQAYAMLVRVEGAASRRVTSEGIFTPGDLLGAIKQTDVSPRHRNFARGDALMQEWAQGAQNVLGSRYPDSGTAGRFMTATPQGLIAGAATAPAALPYTGFGMWLMRNWATPSPAREAIGSGVRDVAPIIAPSLGLFSAQVPANQ